MTASLLARIALLAAGACLLAQAGIAAAQEFPTRAVRMIVPIPPGSAPDAVARVMAEGMAKVLGQAVIVENRPGGQNAVAYEYAAKQVAPDGYNIALGVVPALAAMPLVVKNLRLDPLRDLPPFIGLGETRFAAASPRTLQVKTFEEFVARARANPGKLNYGTTSGAYTAMLEALLRPQGVQVMRIYYTQPIIQALSAGEVHIGILTLPQVLAIKDRIQLLGISGAQRDPNYADVPTFAELGYPRLRGSGYQLNAPVGTPKAVLARLHDAASRTLRAAETRERFAKLQIEVRELSADEAAAQLLEQGEFYASVGKEIGLKPE